MAMFVDRAAATILIDLLARMKELGGAWLEASFQGGNDEGGVEEIHLFQTADRSVEIAVPDEQYRWDDGTLYGLANELLSTKYYDWAGDFSAWGTLYVDAKERKAWEEGTETTEQSIEDPFSASL